MSESKKNFQINPETKIAALLDRFPGLENTLLEMAPEFKKLKNPLLRKTIARVTSLRQASAVSKISLAEMINRLRKEEGLSEDSVLDETEVSFSEEIPPWFSPSKIVKSMDARPMLERGEQPIGKVFAECKNLNAGEIFELVTAFLPSPLMEAAKDKGFLTWVKKEEEELFKTYLMPKSK